MKERETFIDKIKNTYKSINLKGLIKVLTLIFVVALSTLLSLADVGYDFDKLNFNTWLTNTLIMLMISVFGIVMGESMGGDRQKAYSKGLYQQSLKEFDEALASIDIIALYLNDFLLWFKEKETKTKCIKYLMDNEINEAKDIMDYLALEDVDKLLTEPLLLKNGKIVRRKDEQQVEAIKMALGGKITVKSNTSSYYLNAFEKSKSSSELEVGFEVDKQIIRNRRFNRSFKILSSVLFSVIFATITIKEFIGDDPDKKIQAITTLVMRLCTLVGCLGSGWGTSVVDVKLQAKKIKNKTLILHKFKHSYESGEFKPMTYEDLARKEYEECQMAKKEKEILEEVPIDTTQEEDLQQKESELKDER